MAHSNRRSFLQTAATAGAALALPVPSLRAQSPGERVNIGVIGCGWRGGQQIDLFNALEGVRVVGVCDPDQQRIDEAKKKAPQARGWVDLRDMLDDEQIDAVVVTTCNHWHALASIWALQAGKHVYVEKPLAQNIWEGRQVVEAAEQSGKVCAIGTQQRSDPMQALIKAFLHEERELGAIQSVRANRYGVREPIGKRDQPLNVADSVDYNLWLGPAEDQPIFRNELHYDWHWVWNTGSGEMGNWGVHILDDVCNNVFLDQVKMPASVIGGGGRVVWNDAGDTPNVHIASLDADGVPVVVALTNLPSEPGGKDSPSRPGPGSGYIVYCEGGRLEGRRGGAAAYDADGKKMRDFPSGNGESRHQQNFVDAVRAEDPRVLNAPVENGHYSTAWCHLANIAARAGATVSDSSVADAMLQSAPELEPVAVEMSDLLEAHGVGPFGTDSRISGRLRIDRGAERFEGDGAQSANRFIRREFRRGFEVPEIKASVS